jgi:ketosteroid isomerase-like protein
MSHHEKKAAAAGAAGALTHEAVQRWLDAYARAWETYDDADVRALFSDDAEYKWHPADDPEKGIDDIAFAWLNPGGNASSRDKAGTYKAELTPYVVEGNKAVATGVCTYWTDTSRSKVDRIYYNNWLLEFDDAGKCRSFTEYWMVPRKS